MTTLKQAFAHHQAGRLREAEVLYRQVLQAQPRHAQALHLLGLLTAQIGNYETAVSLIQQAIQINPNVPEQYNNLGEVQRALGQSSAAVIAYRHAIALKGDYVDAYYNLGNALQEQGLLAEAATIYQKLLTQFPEHIGAHNNLGVALQGMGHLPEAIIHLERAHVLAPKSAEVCFNLGNAFRADGKLTLAINAYRKALALKPDYPEAHTNLLSVMHYSPGFDAEALYAEARRWASAHTETLTVQALSHTNERSAQRRLRIGYVSSDLCQHPVGFFFAPVFTHHDKQAFELICYAGVRHPDALTAQFQACADRWHQVSALTDEALAERIRADRIDILVDLSGYTERHRLLTFARKPAPVQVTAGGHRGTTGMTAIDYLISDRFHTPAGTERYFSETLIRLPHDYICYRPPDYAPAVARLPLARQGYVTFGCFNNLAKVTPDVVALWSKILKALTGARLRLQTRELEDGATRARYHALFKNEGVETSRIELRGHTPHRQLLAAYGEVDIALDPFPYSGGLTTLEALWMGVPLITLTGHTFAGRHSTSHLANVGLPEFITTTPEAYVAVAVTLAQDPDRLSALRQGLRERMAASPLCDDKGYTRALETAYRGMWEKYCKNRDTSTETQDIS